MSKRNRYRSLNKKVFKKIDKFWQFGKPVGDFMDENPWTWLVILLLVCVYVAYRMDALPFRPRRVNEARADYYEASSSTASSTTSDSTNNNKKTQ